MNVSGSAVGASGIVVAADNSKNEALLPTVMKQVCRDIRLCK
jgi:hypothetical protein